MPDAAIEIGVLGPVSVRVGGEPVALGGRARALLLALAARRNTTVPRDVLVEAVWPDDAPAEARNALQAQVSRLRRALGAAADCLVTEQSGYRLELPPGAVDADRLAAVVGGGAGADVANPTDRAAALADALALWRGDPYLDAADDPAAVAEASRLHELRLDAIEEHAEACLAAGRGSEVVATLREHAAAHPTRERLHRARAHALYQAGRQHDALEVLAALQRRLRDELGLDPDPPTEALQRAILAHDPTLHVADTATAADTEAPKPARPGPARIPAPRTSFVGRVRELAAVRERLAGERAVTLVGPGGTGKTRLAFEAAAVWERDGNGDVAVVELAAVTDPDDVLAHVATAVGLAVPVPAPLGSGGEATAPRPLTDRLAAHLADRDLLVVLDNCEHLLDAAAAAADQLLQAGPGVRVLATSREGLRLPGEARLPVPPLGLPDDAEPPAAGDADADLARLLDSDAVRLFVDRVRAADADFDLDADTAAATVEVCRRLDGLPLAIELAAARAVTMPVQLLAERLSDRFRLLTGGTPTVQRQRTLESVVAWSYDLLTDRQRVVLRRLGVCAVAPAVDVAEAVVAADDVPADEVLPTLAELADKSMVELTAAADPRVRMLETIREFARARLAADPDVEAVRDRHAEVFAERAVAASRGLVGADQLMWLDRLDREHDDFRAALDRLVDGDPAGALRMASSLAWFWWLHEHVAEGTQWLQRALAAAGDSQLPQAAVAWSWLGLLRLFGPSSRDAAATAAARAQELLQRHDSQLDAADRAATRLLTAYVGLALSLDPASALGDIDDALDLAHEAGDRWIETAARFARATALKNMARPEAALDEAQQALALAEASGDRWGRYQTLQLVAQLHAGTGDYAAAREALATAQGLADEMGAGEQVRGMRAQQAMVSMLDGDLDRARDELETILAEARGRHDGTAVLAIHGLGMVAARAGEFDAAVAHHREAAQAFGALDDRYGVAEALAGVAFAAAAQGDAAAAAAAGDAELALRRLGRAAALREPVGATLIAGERWNVDRVEAAARELVGDDTADALLAAGRDERGLLAPLED